MERRTPAEPDPDNLGLYNELEALRKQIDELLGDEDTEGHMAKTDVELQIEKLQARIDRMEAHQRQEIIRKAARFAADVRIANGHAPLGWCWDTRGAFEDGVSKYVDAELKELDQDEANALALAMWELAPSESQEP